MSRKPTELHVLEGTGRADRNTKTVVPIPPNMRTQAQLKDFAEDFDREEVFIKLRTWVESFIGKNAIDEFSLSLIVDQLEIYSIARKHVKEHGGSVSSPNGRNMMSAELNTMNTAHDKFVKLMREFGMTPATRANLKSSGDMDADPLDNFLSG